MDKKKLAIVHIVKKELGLNDQEYRNILNAAAGVNSAKDLDDEKFRKLMNYFVRSRHYQVNPYGLTIRQKILIKALVQELTWDESHLSNFLHKYYYKRALENLTKREAIKLIESLKNIRAHSKTGSVL
jgi:hypothetical protein